MMGFAYIAEHRVSTCSRDGIARIPCFVVRAEAVFEDQFLTPRLYGNGDVNDSDFISRQGDPPEYERIADGDA